MALHQLFFTNAILLFALGTGAYLFGLEGLEMSLVPVGFGVLFGLSKPLVQRQVYMAIVIIALLLGLLIVALFFALWQGIKGNQLGSVVLNGLMILSSGYTFLAFFHYLKRASSGNSPD